MSNILVVKITDYDEDHMKVQVCNDDTDELLEEGIYNKCDWSRDAATNDILSMI